MARPELIALGLCVVAAGLEGIAAGNGVKQRFAALTLPRWAPPLGLWIAIGVAYYVICFMVLRSLLAMPSSGSRTTAVTLIVAIMLINAYWNVLFFRRRDLRLSFAASAVYSLLAVSLWLLLWRIEVKAMLWFTPYVVYLPYANAFGYAVWRANRQDNRGNVAG
jgi:tryptophan-rich sensory protein